MKLFSVIMIYPAVFSLMLLYCSGTSISGGSGGSEITNGKVLAMSGMPAAGVSVTGYPEDYIASSHSTVRIVRTVTDDQGIFELNIDSGVYNLFVIDSTTGAGCCICGVDPREDVGTVVLAALGNISGTIQVDQPASTPFLAVYCIGTPFRMDVILPDSAFRFENVPSGSYAISVARPPLPGCTPGVDCGVGGAGSGRVGEVTVTAGATAEFDTVVNSNSLSILP